MLFYEQGSGLDGRPITLELGREYLCHYLGFEPSASEARAAFAFSGFILREPPASADLTIGILLRSAETLVPVLEQLHLCVETDRKGRLITGPDSTVSATASAQFEGFGVGNCEQVRFPSRRPQATRSIPSQTSRVCSDHAGTSSRLQPGRGLCMA